MALRPIKLSNARVYYKNRELLGTADVELPKIEFETEALKGLGIAGELEIPNPANIKPMSIKLKFNSITSKFTKLTAPEPHTLEIYGAVELHDTETKKIVVKQARAYIVALPKSSSTGKVEVGKQMDNEFEGSVMVFKLEYDGSMKYEIDPENFALRIDGVDYLQNIRTALGG